MTVLRALSTLPVRTGQYDGGGSLTTAWLPDPTSPTGTALAESAGGVGSWLLIDPFANITSTVTAGGSTVSGTRTLGAFGGTRQAATGTLAGSATGFAGQYLDTVTGLYDMRARDYDPTIGRFTAEDPVAIPTGMPYTAGYAYTLDNPLTGTDPTGRWVNDCGIFSGKLDDGPPDEGSSRSWTDSAGRISNRWGVPVREVKKAIENLKGSASVRTSGGRRSNPDVEVNLDNGDVRIQGGDGEVVDNLHDYLNPTIVHEPHGPSINWGPIIGLGAAGALILLGGILTSPLQAAIG